MGSLSTFRPIAYYYQADTGKWEYVCTTTRFSRLKGAAMNLPLTYGNTQRDADPQRWRVGYDTKLSTTTHPVPRILASKSSPGHYVGWTGKRPVTPNMKGD